MNDNDRAVAGAALVIDALERFPALAFAGAFAAGVLCAWLISRVARGW